MKILIVNDDGIEAEGIQVLARTFDRNHDVTVIAPDSERSGFSHSVTIFRPLSYAKRPKPHFGWGDGEKWVRNAYSVCGTPADCVKLAVLHLLKDQKIDLVLSGINSGPNLGSDIMYSGTVAAASEGTLLGIPSIAVSIGGFREKGANKFNGDGVDELYLEAAQFVKRNLDTLYQLVCRYRGKMLLNINYPVNEFKGVKITKTGVNSYLDYYEYKENGDRVDAVLKGKPVLHKDDIGNENDVILCKEGYCTITPLRLERTYQEIVERYKERIKFV